MRMIFCDSTYLYMENHLKKLHVLLIVLECRDMIDESLYGPLRKQKAVRFSVYLVLVVVST